MFPKHIYFEPAALDYPLGRELKERYTGVPWHPVISHNNIEELRTRDNTDFIELKKYLIIGIRKTHKYTTNQKISDYLVPYSSSGCSAMCLYCYLVCNYNKCAYLRVYVNREEMLEKLINRSQKELVPKTFEIGSNSDLVLEQRITGSPARTIEAFGKEGKGNLTFPSKFSQVDPFLNLAHQGKTIFRMSVNPQEIIRQVEIGTSPLTERINALNQMAEAGYPVGLIVAPIILLDGWQKLYADMLDTLVDLLTPKAKKHLFIEVIFMTYSYIHKAINDQAFPKALKIYHKEQMTGRGRGKYVYRSEYRQEVEAYLRREIGRRFPGNQIVYIV